MQQPLTESDRLPEIPLKHRRPVTQRRHQQNVTPSKEITSASWIQRVIFIA
jgi:hypothetical protein